MQGEAKKQFSLSLLVRIFLGLLVVVSIGVFANSVMYYNQLNAEAEELQAALSKLSDTRAELEAHLGSAEEVNKLLSDYETCLKEMESATEEGGLLLEYQIQLEEIRELLNNSKNKDYITKVARDALGLYYADEEIFYNDNN